jgi:integrase
MALACFLGLRPGEIAALKWEDFDEDHIHIRRSIAGGLVGTTKTPESVASLPLIDHALLFLDFWRQEKGNPNKGWVLENERGNPVNLKDMVHRTIRPAVEAKKLEWKSNLRGPSWSWHGNHRFDKQNLCCCSGTPATQAHDDDASVLQKADSASIV